jgi:hypothetical protein
MFFFFFFFFFFFCFFFFFFFFFFFDRKKDVVLSVHLDDDKSRPLPMLICEVKDRGSGVRLDENGKSLFDGAAARSEVGGKVILFSWS